jgi:hypothetical protein
MKKDVGKARKRGFPRMLSAFFSRGLLRPLMIPVVPRPFHRGTGAFIRFLSPAFDRVLFILVFDGSFFTASALPSSGCSSPHVPPARFFLSEKP